MPRVEKEEIIRALRSKGLRVTPQRFAVYANLLARRDHPTAEQILKQLNQEVPTLSQATVYLTLQTLSEVGLIREVLLEQGVCRYDANMAPHHHFVCTSCSQIIDIPWDCLAPINLSSLPPGFQVERYEVTFYGKCNQCGDRGERSQT